MAINIDLSGVRTKMSQRNINRAQYFAANQAMLLMNAKYVPMSDIQKVNRLRTESHVDQNGNIVYEMPYAARQFYGVGIGMDNYTTPGTSRRWDLRLKGNQQDMNAVTRAAGKEFN